MKYKQGNKTISIDKKTIGIVIDKKHIALVDKEDYPLVRMHKWSLHNLGYAKCTIRKDNRATTLLMHNAIIPHGREFDVDHKNGNKLDNRQNTGNLRLLTHAENLLNKAGWSKCGYKGAYKMTVGKRTYWLSRIAGKHLGSFKTKLQAALAYDLAAMLCFPGICATNFTYEG